MPADANDITADSPFVTWSTEATRDSSKDQTIVPEGQVEETY
jgi:hypothetical protein